MKKISIIVGLFVLFVSHGVMAADANAGKAKSALCASCHGTAGISPVGIYPNLAGQKEQYLVKQINDFRSGSRKDPTMQAMVAALTDADVEDIAAFYAGIK